MKKIFKITIIMFLVSSILQILLNYIINEQILSRLLFGLDYSTYLMNYYQGISGFIGLISDAKMPYEWLFTISKYIIVFCCVILLFFTIKKIGKNNTINNGTIFIISFTRCYNIYFFIFQNSTDEIFCCTYYIYSFSICFCL